MKQLLKKNLMINGVKGFRKIKEYTYDQFTFI